MVDDAEGCRRAHRALLETVVGIDDAVARADSLLPGWTVGHLLTHIARNADSTTRRLEGARHGEIVDQYPGGMAGRAAEIAEGAGRPAAELVADVTESARRFEAAVASMPETAWDRPTRDVAGVERPAGVLVGRRWREVEVHHVDLGLGYTAADWPDEFVAAWLPRQLAELPARADPKALLLWSTGRGGAPDLGDW